MVERRPLADSLITIDQTPSETSDPSSAPTPQPTPSPAPQDPETPVTLEINPVEDVSSPAAGEKATTNFDLSAAQHRFLRTFAFERDLRQVEVVRALIAELSADPNLVAAVEDRLGIAPPSRPIP